MSPLAVDGGVDGHTAATALNENATAPTCNTSGMLIGGVDVAINVQVPEGRVVNVAERRTIRLVERLGVCPVTDGQRVVVAVESAVKGLYLALGFDTCHGVDRDVGTKFDELACERCSVVDCIGESVPLVGSGDEVWVGLRAVACDVCLGGCHGQRVIGGLAEGVRICSVG